MKKRILLILMMLCLLGLTACAGGNVDNVEVTKYSSSVYTDEEIEAAIDVAVDYFEKEFSGCTLTEITYGGDDMLKGNMEFATRHNADEVIVLLSSFDVDASGGDGSLNPDSTYTGWQWILVRNNGGKWRHVDHGY